MRKFLVIVLTLLGLGAGLASVGYAQNAPTEKSSCHAGNNC